MLKKHLTFITVILLSGFVLGFYAAPAVTAGVSVDWTKYHNYAETTRILKEYAAGYKNICKLYSIGKSFQGKEIWCLEISDFTRSKAGDRPGVYIDGNTHAGEVSGAETCLYIIDFLLSGYGKDTAVTSLIDTRVFYILPKINPDGSDSYLRKPGSPTPEGLIKVDDDEDGVQDEDGTEDLNQDGIISTMRIRDNNGDWKSSSKDNRLMQQRKIDEKGEWRIIGPEGLDNDEDGKINEDPPGRAATVSNRNYPAYWAPEWIQSGGGAYPLSEPEAKAQVDFILAHPNIALIQAFHTHSGVILRPYCNLGDDHIPSQDMIRFRAIGELGTEITRYPVLSVYNDFTSDKSNPRHGVFVDWAYDHFGAFALTTEIWKAPGETGRSAFEGRDESIAMVWNDKEIGGRGFVNWEKFDHPQYGEVEIGGWVNNYFTQNPPPEFTTAEWRKNCLFELKRAELLAFLNIAAVKVEPLGDKLFRVRAIIENTGYLPTNITQKAIQNGQAKTVAVKLELMDAELLCGDINTNIGHIQGKTPGRGSMFRTRGRLKPGNQKNVTWLVRTRTDNAGVQITAVSQKAGTVSRKIRLR